MATRWSCFALVLGLVCAVERARASDPADALPSGDPSGGAVAGVQQNRPFWSGSGPARGFMAAKFDLGVVYFRPTLQFGYGKPHHSWIGAEGTSGLSISGGRMYAGVHGKYPGIDAKVGVRYEFPVDQNFLPVLDSYNREDLETEKTPQSKYISAEAQIDGTLNVPGGSIIAVLSGYYLTDIPEGLRVFEENLKVVVEPPWLWRARLGYLLHIGWIESMKLGAAAEVIHVPARETITVRVGPLISVGLTHHLEVSGGVMLSVYSPDELGLTGADVAQLGFIYRWATGDRWSDFP